MLQTGNLEANGTFIFSFHNNHFCVSVTDQMQFFTDAPLSPNMRTQMYERFWRRSAKRGLLNNSQ